MTSANPHAPFERGGFRIALHLLLFTSGALALVYEVLWMRRFASIFGASTPAVAATLAAVFLGFMAGSLFVGRRAARITRPLRAYGLLEMGVGIGALLVPAWLRLYDQVYPGLYHGLSGSPTGFAVVKTLLAFAALFLPTFCMGGTVPLIGQAIAAQQRRLGLNVGGLYASNTLGAALGAFSVPFFWLPQLGLVASYGICVGGSLLVGVLACVLDRGAATLDLSAAADTGSAAKATGKERIPIRAVGLLAALSGFLIFVLQVAWERMFAQVHENSIYSFSVVLAVLLVALAIGAALARQCLARIATPKRLLGYAWLAAGAFVFVTPHLFYSMTHGLTYLKGSGGWTSYGLQIVWLSSPTVLLPGLLAGMALPLLMEMGGHASDQSSGRILGSLLALNTAGAVAGALLGAFVFPHLLGLWMTLAGAGLVLLCLGQSCLSPWQRGWRFSWLMFCVCVAAGFLLFNPTRVPRTRLRAEQGENLLALAEGGDGIVAVVGKERGRRIKLNNFYILGGTASTGDERLQGHLPLLLHPAPKRVAFLGLGTGITAGAALLHPVERITAIEIVPEVISAARTFFAEANLGVAESARTDLIVEDARNYLRGSPGEFDVIVGDLVVPWRHGEASLYTADHFASARRSLAPGGIFCQWLPMFQFSEMEFNMVAATFLEVFPATTIWRGDFAPDQPALALIGMREGGGAIDPAMVERRVRQLTPDSANPFLSHPAGVWMFIVGALNPAADRFTHARRNRENRPWLELLGPLHHAGASGRDTPLFVGRRLEMFLDEVRAQTLASSALSQLGPMQLQWRDAGARLAMSSILTAEGSARDAEAMLKEAVSSLPVEIRGAFGDTAGPPPEGSVQK